ncbi:hypothetical protein AB0H71_02625 [Nocardia sp. NPDC050697]|uniref:hypothetical protein n=1 Tax=Nocardia sp. NPDC050697 TaxID=3155158 RepID=UPI0033D4ABE1
MPGTAQLMVTVLPHSIAPDAPCHLSLFLTHRLSPGETGSLADIAAMANWVAALRTARITLRTDAGTVTGTPVLDPLDESAWATAFPPETPVRGFPAPVTTNAPWKSYPANRLPEHALEAHYVSAFSSPVTRPSPGGSRLARAILAVLDRTIATDGEAPNLRRTLDAQKAYDAAKRRRRTGIADRAADRTAAALGPALTPPPPDPPPPPPPPPSGPHLTLTEATGEQPTWRSPLEAPLDACDTEISTFLDAPAGDSDSGDPVLAMLRDTHATQRFYQRDGEQRRYAQTPADGAHEPRPEPPVPDFHARAATIGGVPALARRLGFVLDIRVAELDTLAAATLICCDLAVEGFEPLVGPATRCLVDGQRFLAAPDTDAWSSGFLTVGRPDRFRVLDLDPDASGLKLEQLLRGTVRSVATELNGDPAAFTPGTLRSSGFSLAHIDRPTELLTRVSAAEQLSPQVAADDVPLDARPRLGFEALARGYRLEVWDDSTGQWHSLHERLVSADHRGTPVLTDAPDTGYLQNAPLARVPGNPGNAYYVHEVIAGWDGWSLAAPRPGLRVVHDSGQGGEPGREMITDRDERPGPERDGLGIRSVAAPRTLPALRYGRRYSFRLAGVDLAGNSVARGTATAPPDPAAVAAATAHLAALRADADARDAAALLARSRGDAAAAAPAGDAGVAAVEHAMDAVENSATRLTTRPQLDIEPERFAALFAAETADPATVTTPRLFLRWEAVLPPAVVPRTPYSVGESLHRLVIRDGATNTERHLAPPKSTQLDAELDGRFDALMTSPDPADRRRAYAIALAERGSLLHQRIQNLDEPDAEVEQPGIALHAGPGADPAALVDLAALQDDPERQPAEGQYVVHDVDQLVLPYLPDSMARGIALIFYRAGTGHTLRDARILQSVVVPYAGAWPRIEPLRLVLHGAPVLHAEQNGNVLDIGVPPGEQIAVAVSSVLDREHLNRLGLWRFHAVHDPAVTEPDRAVLERAALDGWLWWLTPGIDLRLVHATLRPAVAPELTALTAPARNRGVATAELVGALDIHGASTDRVELRATWTDLVDDPALDAPGPVPKAEVVTGFAVGAGERRSLFSTTAAPVAGTREPGVPVRPIVHALPDTRYREVDYRLHGTTRYREFFPAEQLPAAGDELSAGAARRVLHPNSAPPPTPLVHEVVPMFRWEDESEPEHPFARRRTRRSGVRVWLDRPWLASGDGELLAVVVGTAPQDGTSPEDISLWGRDPAFVTAGLRNATDLQVTPAWQQRALQLRLDPGEHPGRPVGYVDIDDHRAAYLYRPEYHPERRRWFADIVFDAAETAWPFVRLTLARYQPHSAPGCFHSPTVATDYVQLLPERIATLSRPEAGQVRVTVSGSTAFTDIPGLAAAPAPPGPERPAAFVIRTLPTSRRVVATLQLADPGTATDLGWTKVGQVQCEVVGAQVTTDPADGHLTALSAGWSGLLHLDPALRLRTPGATPDLRVLIEEYELLPTDPEPGAPEPATLSRLVYADHLYL